MDEGVEMIELTIPSVDDALAFVQPSKQSFNLSALIAHQRSKRAMIRGLGRDAAFAV